ncbi:MAG: hypothetical protein LH614_22085 [Pyrinomonadaceae bacterium]|nr:hypothetical protein [Pyrinomonadaceae bacterium]
MNCRDYTAEFEERAALSETATRHLNDCSDCRKTSDAQNRVWEMIDGLSVVDAPKTFDFLVKARIAQAKSAHSQPRFLPILRYVLPLSVVVLVLGVFAFNNSFFFGDNLVPPVAEVAPPKPTVAEDAPNNFSMPENFAAVNNSGQSFVEEKVVVGTLEQSAMPPKNQSEIQVVAVKSTGKPPNELRRRNQRNSSDGVESRDLSLTEQKTLFPENLDPNKTVENMPNAGNPNPLDDEKIWSFIGLEISTENGGRKVKTIAPKSYAERLGVKVGDVIVAIDGVKLSAELLRVNTFEGKTLTVVRGAEKIRITLANKSNQ